MGSMKVWLLLIYMGSPHEGGIEAIEFTSEELCRAAEETIVAWFEDVNFGIFKSVQSVCIEVEK